MRSITIPLALLCVPLAVGQSVSPVGYSESEHLIHAFSPSGDVTLPLVRVQLDIVYPRGKKERGDLVIVYDSSSGHYFWRYTPLNHPGDATSFLGALESGAETAYATPEALFDFSMPGALYEKEHRERADSLDAAVRASIAEIERGLALFEGAGYHTDGKALPVITALGPEFACPPLSQMCNNGANRIVSISRRGDNWRLVLRNRFDQEVILDPRFDLVSTRRLTEPARE